LTLTSPKVDVAELIHPISHIETGFINKVTLHHLALLGGNQKDFLRTVIYGFLSETDKLLEAMRFALSKQEYATFKELAHILKGSSGNVGAEAMFAVCGQILALDSAELKKSATYLLDEALESYPVTRDSLLQYLHGSNQATL